MPSINDRIGSQNVIRVLSNASSPPTKLNSLTDVDDTQRATDGLILVWDSSTEKYYLTNTIDAASLVSTGVVNFTNTEQSTSTSSGALVVGGGAGISKNLYVGESLDIGENVNVSGLSTFLDKVFINNFLSVSGFSTFTSTENNVLGNADTGAVQIDGGLGVAKNVTVGAGLSVATNLYVGGTSEFIGNATFRGGTIGIGDADTDDINVAGEFVSNLVPNDNNTYDLGIDGKRWRTGRFSTLLDTNNLQVTGFSTFASDLDVNASVDISTDLTVDGLSDLDELNVAGLSTFVSNVDINASADILNNLNVSGVATVNQGLYYTGGNFNGPNGIAYFDSTGKLIGAASTESGISTTNYVLTTNTNGLPVWTTTIDGGEYWWQNLVVDKNLLIIA